MLRVAVTDQERGQCHYGSRGKAQSAAPGVEIQEIKAARAVNLSDQTVSDEKSGNDRESDEAAREPRNPSVEKYDDQHGHGTKVIDLVRPGVFPVIWFSQGGASVGEAIAYARAPGKLSVAC